MVLHLGCGRFSHLPGLVTVDRDATVDPDVICELGVDRLPFEDDSVEAAVAIHVLEHIGRAGETAGWFQFWEELYRVLRPEGTLTFESPLYSSVWAWADPSHVRALSPQAFAFLDQDSYRLTPSSISPYRIQCDFTPAGSYTGLADAHLPAEQAEAVSHFRGTLKARKPLRPWWASDE